jgi:hypothetical protein
MLQDGNPTSDLFIEDDVHMSDRGVSHLASNMKKAIHNKLGIETVGNRQSRTMSKVNAGRNRAFNRKY